jgi:anti-sigma regulatory factor (Ser/Thr protein kinase)
VKPELTCLTQPAELQALQPFTNFVRHGAQVAQMPERDLGRLDLVLEEILVNVIQYAYPEGQPGTIKVGYAVEGPGKLLVTVSDNGRAFDPLARDPPDLRLGLAERPIGGLGIVLVRRIVDSIEYQRAGDSNVLSFRFVADQG